MVNRLNFDERNVLKSVLFLVCGKLRTTYVHWRTGEWWCQNNNAQTQQHVLRTGEKSAITSRPQPRTRVAGVCFLVTLLVFHYYVDKRKNKLICYRCYSYEMTTNKIKCSWILFILLFLLFFKIYKKQSIFSKNVLFVPQVRLTDSE